MGIDPTRPAAGRSRRQRRWMSCRCWASDSNTGAKS